MPKMATFWPLLEPKTAPQTRTPVRGGSPPLFSKWGVWAKNEKPPRFPALNLAFFRFPGVGGPPGADFWHFSHFWGSIFGPLLPSIPMDIGFLPPQKRAPDPGGVPGPPPEVEKWPFFGHFSTILGPLFQYLKTPPKK